MGPILLAEKYNTRARNLGETSCSAAAAATGLAGQALVAKAAPIGGLLKRYSYAA